MSELMLLLNPQHLGNRQPFFPKEGRRGKGKQCFVCCGTTLIQSFLRPQSSLVLAARFNPTLSEEATVFQGKPLRKDRRKKHVKEADELAEAYFAGEYLWLFGSCSRLNTDFSFLLITDPIHVLTSFVA